MMQREGRGRKRGGTACCWADQNAEKEKKAKKQGRNRQIEDRNQKAKLIFQRGADGQAENDCA